MTFLRPASVTHVDAVEVRQVFHHPGRQHPHAGPQAQRLQFVAVGLHPSGQRAERDARRQGQFRF